ncbi:MAG TPA: translation initiation factor IF-2 [Candidatus Paceibacterota bacterium]|nr:translation initiation factor IF-2 [Candidatus Paceibacterota bacterium]
MAEEKKKSPASEQIRPPVVAVMGHVDHGKTTLLDYIRKTTVASREAGGITQSIGAYEITHTQTDADNISVNQRSNQRESAPAEGRKITFIDTPGHEAFIKMRSRGANIADLAILVVAADEGFKPQTKESIKILEETKTQFIVAITKIDKNNADIERVKNELMTNGVMLEGYGGQISYQPVSAKTGEGVNELLDLILLAAELENLTYDKNATASGYVLEAKMDRRRGLEATVIIKNGILKTGESISTDTAKGKVKIMENFAGVQVKELAPSSPALIIGFETLPQIGEEFSATEKSGLPAVNQPNVPEVKPLNLPEIRPSNLPATEESPALHLIIKASDSGSLEALSGIIKAIAEQKPIKIIAESVGDVNDNDVKMAISSKAVIIAFRSKTEKGPKYMADIGNIKIISSEIIYELVKAIEDFLVQLEKPAPFGTLRILAVFNQSDSKKQVVGGKVESGIFRNKSQFGIERDGIIIATGRVNNLQQQKKDATEVTEGKEAGLLINSDTMVKTGDLLIIEK